MKRVWNGVRKVDYCSGDKVMSLIYDVREEKPHDCYQHQRDSKLFDFWFDSLDDTINFLREGQKNGYKLTNISLDELEV